MFTDTVRSEWYKNDKAKEKLARKLTKVENLKTALAPGEEMVTAALQFVTSHPIQPVAIAGAKSPAQVAVNASAGQMLLSSEERARLVEFTKTQQSNLAIA